MANSLHFSPSLIGVLLFSTLSLSALSGCQLLAGIEKAEEDPNFQPGGDGDDGTGGNNGDGDGDGDAILPGLKYAPDSCSKELDIAQADFTACLMRVSCDPAVPDFSLSACLSYGILSAWPNETCSADAETCDDVEDCLQREYLEEDDLSACFSETQTCSEVNYETCNEVCVGICDGSCDLDDQDAYGNCNGPCIGSCTGYCCNEPDLPAVACDGDEAIFCSEEPYKVNCGEFNATCAGPDTAPTTVMDLCTPNAGIDCNTAAYTGPGYHCAGQALFSCATGEALGHDCPSGSVCSETSSAGNAYCSSNNGSCTNYSEWTCNNNVASFCTPEGLRESLDCNVAGLTCETDGLGAACGTAGCDPYAFCEDSCIDSDRAQICVGGAKLEVDCKALGFDYCETNNQGFAQCRNNGLSPGGGDDGFGAPADDSCALANNGSCDEVDGGCPRKTDKTDCGDTCDYAHDGICDVPGDCADGTDDTDCGKNP